MELIEKTQEYLNYIDEHICNVQIAWDNIKERCEHPIFTDVLVYKVNELVLKHDKSKLSVEEFIPYRNKFFPTNNQKEEMDNNEEYSKEIRDNFKIAWDHHKKINKHHWQEWTKLDDDELKNCYFIEMICDWIAMSMNFGGTAREYYEKNKDTMNIPDKYEKIMYTIFNQYYGKKFKLL